MTKLPIGKLRGIQEIANEQGIFTILANDHRGSLRKQLASAGQAEASFDDMVNFKMMLASTVGPYASAILIDPEFGAAQAIVHGKWSGHRGLLVSLEATGYEGDPAARKSGFIPGWGVEKIKRMGASAVKLLLYYNMKAPTAAQQEALTQQAAADCEKYDIPFLLETVTYEVTKGEDKGTMVIESAKRLAPMGVDIYKSEFPGTLQQSDSELAANCNKLTEVLGNTPWVLLTAGVDWEEFKRQANIAMRSGASGFLAGRAIWKEATKMSWADRENFLKTMATERFKELVGIAEAHCVPWTTRRQSVLAGLKVGEGWWNQY